MERSVRLSIWSEAIHYGPLLNRTKGRIDQLVNVENPLVLIGRRVESIAFIASDVSTVPRFIGFYCMIPRFSQENR